MDRDATNDQQPARTNSGVSPGSEGLPGTVSIPDHQLLQCIGRGSYGEVWLARNMMGVYRAVKIVYRKAFKDQRPFERELSGIRKFEPISRSHEGFVDVLHVGINDEAGYFFYVMELGDDQASGQSIDPGNYSPKTLGKEISVHGKLPFSECLQLGLALSLSLAELHKHGLVHRDVKPSNIIFVNGVPKLADIGLVAEVAEARSYVGTEGFIPPEGPGNPQADVYSLGKVLYEASTGKDRQAFPELPTLVDDLADQGFWELNDVILQACRNDLAQRYRSAWDLHADLLVLANGKSVKRLKLLERRLANLKKIAGVSSLAILALAAIGYLLYRDWRGIIESRQREVGANVAYGNRDMESGDLLGALPYFADALKLDERKNEITHRLRFASVLAQCPKLTLLWTAGTRVNDGQFSPDGKSILIAEYFGKARILDAQTGKLQAGPFGTEGGLLSLAYSPDGQFVVTANHSGSASVWRADGLEEVWHLTHPDRVFNARFSPDGLRMVTCCADGAARVWNVRTRQLELSLKQGDGVLFADFSPDGRLIVTAGDNSTAKIWDASDGHALGPPLEHSGWVTFAAFSPDGQRLVTASMDHKARVWEVPSGRRIMPDLEHRDGVKGARYSPDGRLILTASFDGTVRFWHADTLQPLVSNPILKLSDRVTSASFDPDGRRILATCADGTVRVWDLASSLVHSIPVRYALSQDGTRFLSVTNDHIEILDTASGRAVGPIIAPALPLVKAEVNRNGGSVVSVSLARPGLDETNYLAQVWDPTTGKALGPAILVSNKLTGVVLSDDGKRLVTVDETSAHAWDVLTGTSLFAPLERDDPINEARFSPDGSRIAISSDKQVQICDSISGVPRFKPLEHPMPVSHVEFSPDGSRLVTCCSDPLITKCFAQVWNAVSGQPIGPQLRHNDGVLYASFSLDGRRVVTASEDFTAIVWNAATGKQLAPSLNHQHQVRTACFCPDGKWVATASWDQTTRVWSADTGDPLTPPLRQILKLNGSKLSSAKFLADGRRILTSDRMGNSWIWELSADDRPVEDLLRLAELLSGRALIPSGQSNSPQPDSLQRLWERLRNEYPSSFTVSTREIALWHECQADACEVEQQWSAVAFHLERLLALRPGDPSLLQRLNRARTHR